MKQSTWMKYIRPYFPYFIIGPVCMLVEVAGEVILPKLFSGVINSANDGTLTVGGSVGTMLLMILTAVLMMAGGVGGAYFGAKASVNFAADLRADAYAKVHENGSFGKTECWYIMDAPENATLVIGHNAKTKEELASMIHEGRWNEFIREIPVKKGDFIQIDPGTVHAIKGGLLILETQQNSDITYRVYDYDRLSNGKPRQLHIEQSIDVITVPAKAVEDSVKSTEELAKNQWNELYSCGYYTVFCADVDGRLEFEQKYPFLICSVLEGDGIVASQPVKKGDHFILPSGFGNVEMQGAMRLIASTVQ